MTRNAKWLVVNASALLLELGGFSAPSFADTASDQWFVPYYFDIGTGGSQLTWRGIAGLGYRFSWGDVVAAWRYLDYQFSNHSSTLAMNGPAIGVGFRW